MRDKRQLTTGEPVPADGSHTELKSNGQQKAYVVLSPEERAKGFVKPVRDSYVHKTCGVQTVMGRALSETYARDPHFYSGTFCTGCGRHFPLSEFHWEPDGEPMNPELQAHWHEVEKPKREAVRDQAIKEARHRRIAVIEQHMAELEREIARLRAEDAQ